MFLALALVCLSSDPPGELVLPPGPAHAAWARTAGVEARVPAGAGTAWPVWGDPAWETPAPWERFERLLESEESAARAYDLALLARAQGRDGDLWRHFAALADPGALAALEAAVFAAVAADGTLVLRPPLPPPDPARDERRFVGRELARTWTTGGGTTLTLTVKIEPDGTQVDVLHGGGPPVDLSVAMPIPPGVRVAVAYADWARQDDPAAPIAFTASAEDPEHTAWGRYLPAPRAWPRRAPGELPAGFREAGLELVWEGAGAPPARLAHAAASFGRLLGVPARVVDGVVPAAGASPLRIHLGPDQGPKEIDLFGLVERRALPTVSPAGDARDVPPDEARR